MSIITRQTEELMALFSAATYRATKAIEAHDFAGARDAYKEADSLYRSALGLNRIRVPEPLAWNNSMHTHSHWRVLGFLDRATQSANEAAFQIERCIETNNETRAVCADHPTFPEIA